MEQKVRVKKFEILEHTADLKIRVFGRTKEELFSAAMRGMFEAAKYQQEVKSQKSKVKIKINSSDTSSLLVDFLSEVLYLCEANKEVYGRVVFNKFSDERLEATLTGQKLKNIGLQIKGVTFHGLDIHQEKDGLWQAVILFDI